MEFHVDDFPGTDPEKLQAALDAAAKEDGTVVLGPREYDLTGVAVTCPPGFDPKRIVKR